MFTITFRDVPIQHISILNRPSYMRQNTYGNLVYIPIVAPVSDVTIEDCRKPDIVEACKKYKSMDEVINAFFLFNPETEEGHLKDSKFINFLGFKYEYHPKHKTYYGAIPKQYMLLSILARWSAAVQQDIFDEDKLSRSLAALPPEYNGGNGNGVIYYIDSNPPERPDGDMTGVAYSSMKLSSDKFGDCLVDITAPGSACRAVCNMKNNAKYDKEMDDLISKFGESQGNMLIANTSPMCVYPKLAEGIYNGTKKLFVCVTGTPKDIPDTVSSTGIKSGSLELYVIKGCTDRTEFSDNWPEDWRK